MTDDLKDLRNPEPPRMLVDTAAWYALEAENERLREALKKIEQGDDGRGADYVVCYECADKHEIARAALIVAVPKKK